MKHCRLPIVCDLNLSSETIYTIKQRIRRQNGYSKIYKSGRRYWI